MKNEYLILGDNNKWYATCRSMADMRDELKRLEKEFLNGTDFDGDESPETIYCYKAQVKFVAYKKIRQSYLAMCKKYLTIQ